MVIKQNADNGISKATQCILTSEHPERRHWHKRESQQSLQNLSSDEKNFIFKTQLLK